ncbi:ATPase component of general energizing module of ECF transporters [Liquorilactobacillus sucicola DSM 21376 = JCM 15457]|uniref:Cobalt transporter ATP-binding subunit n=1 Tax=Liquorilactobacillus sucicola DSM 21376 = JCM 15457 TaxID=1423806 RepID=A0A023CZA9_9LACO|nr:energy-coupling factor ABC transporter ATP-binding protein [Liquorilactobacillus sucicola]KRN05772.1 cobalt transporter ATP-binding subunit [Liquorilactobacillus sucicola DSM 21376 = JCM 15457]GAJ27243.1 ATPase component of general energizing module of ECF transporters [Liquorilactobacillus sucicola DSM 21376 = JCM 15457]
MEEPMIEISDLSFQYPQQESEALSHLNLAVAAGEWLAVIGHNGSGKSTLAKLIDGLLIPKTGTIKIAGVQLTSSTLWNIRKNIGMVFQNPDNQFVGANVEEDVAFGLENQGVPRETMIKRVEAALTDVGMWDFAQHEPARLSGGQKQRVALAGVIALQPKIIIMDEATSMLDPEGRKEIIQLIQNLNKKNGFTVISITHDIEEASLAQRVVVIDDGLLVQDDKPAKVFQRGAALIESGLDIPFSEKLKNEIRNQGIDVPQEYLTEKGMVDWLCQFISKK